MSFFASQQTFDVFFTSLGCYEIAMDRTCDPYPAEPKKVDLLQKIDKELVEDQEPYCHTSSCMQSVQKNPLMELYVPDFGKVKAYYGKLGFEVVRRQNQKAKPVILS